MNERSAVPLAAQVYHFCIRVQVNIETKHIITIIIDFALLLFMPLLQTWLNNLINKKKLPFFI